MCLDYHVLLERKCCTFTQIMTTCGHDHNSGVSADTSLIAGYARRLGFNFSRNHAYGASQKRSCFMTLYRLMCVGYL